MTVSVDIPAPLEVVWEDVRHVESHVEWMADAVAIRFTSPTTFECDTKIGPFRTTDDLELATLAWVHWFNEQRLHSSIGLVPPLEFENEHYRRINPQRHPSPGELASH